MSEVEKIVSICHKIYKKGFVAAYDGNVSLITSDNTVLFTRSGVCKGDVTEEDILEFDLSGSGRASARLRPRAPRWRRAELAESPAPARGHAPMRPRVGRRRSPWGRSLRCGFGPLCCRR